VRLRRRINNMLKGRHLIDPMDFSVEEMDNIFELAGDIINNPVKYSDSMKGKLLATLFYEPSTRTRFSFEAAMMRLGGQVIGFSEPGSSSVSKGESVADTIKTVGCYADIAVMRHPKEGAPKVASLYSDIPVINAGDGGHQHPTQTLTDLLTIKTVKGRLSDLTIGFCGDLKFGRTVHSLIKALSRYENIKIVLISPDELKVPEYIRNEILIKNNIDFTEAERIEDVIGDLDILYMTRVQKERFFNEDDYIRLKDRFILDREKMELAKESMIVLHPLPRVNEIAYEIDNDPRAMYFKQAKYGMYVRMALMIKLLGVK
jgi:aspartate carbamoyltransferase catalytic subunit